MPSQDTRNSKINLTYDPKTGSWVPSASTDNSKVNTTPSQSTNPPNDDTNSNQSKADKEYIEAEFNVLTGELNLTPTAKSIRIKVNDTVKIEGLGKYLSGLYFVASIKRTFSKDGGYSHSISVLKNGFGDSVKKPQQPETSTRKDEVNKQSSGFKVGDSVKIVGSDAVYSNAHDGVKVPNWVKKKTLTVQKISNDNTRVLLQPINSWTYIKYVQKV